MCSRLKIHDTQPVSSENFRHFLIASRSHEKRYQALPPFLYCKQQKAGWGLGTRLVLLYSVGQAQACPNYQYDLDNWWELICQSTISKRDLGCTSSQFRCSNGQCISSSSRCNGYRTCSDGSDEMNCCRLYHYVVLVCNDSLNLYVGIHIL